MGTFGKGSMNGADAVGLTRASGDDAAMLL